MKRSALLVALAAVAIIPATGDAAPPKRTERKITLAYQGFCDVGVPDANVTFTNCPTPSKIAETIKAGEAYVSFSAADSLPGKVGLIFFNTSDFAGTAQSFCGDSGKPIKVKAKQEMAVEIALDPTCGAVPTSGTLTMIISNLP